MGKIELTKEQQEIVVNRGGTLLVSAAAGSGKTRVLVERVVSRLRDEHRNINEFLIITFTSAAAAELRAKITDGISKAIAAQPLNKHMQRQLKLLDLAQISTVHAFCGRLIRQYGYLLDIPSDYSMLDENERQELMEELLGDILEEEYTKLEPDFTELSETLGAGRNDLGLNTLLLNLFSKLQAQVYPEHWFAEHAPGIAEGTELTENLWGRACVLWAQTQIDRLIARHHWAIQTCEADEQLRKKYYPAYLQQLSDLERIRTALDGPWDRIGPALTVDYFSVSARNCDESLKNAVKAVRDDTKAVVKKLQVVFGRNQETLISEQNSMALALQSAFRIISELDLRFSAEKRRRNVLDFNDQEHLAIRLLVKPDGSLSEAAREISQQFCEIMVDEYQDSNRVQERIFTAISTMGDTNRVLVGDIKQSIYGFREAEPEMFREKYRCYRDAALVESGDPQPRKLILSKNFRSRPEILESANYVFSSLMSEEIGELTYGKQERLYAGRTDFPVDHKAHVALNILLTEGSDDAEEDSGENNQKSKYQLEAEWTAEKISGLLKEGLPVQSEHGTRPAVPQDFAILLRGNDPMPLYRKALEDRGIPVCSEHGGNLFDEVEIRVLLNFLRVADNPHQDIPLLSVLCSPVFHCSNEQLAQLRLADQKGKLYDAMGMLEEPWCRDAREQLDSLRKLSGTMSADEFVWHILYSTGLLTDYCAMDHGSERYRNLISLYEFCRNRAAGKHIYLYELLKILDRAAAAGTLTSAAGGDGVTITTIHKSKGLEYPVVFLCDLSRKFNFRELSNTVLFDGEQGVASKIIDREQCIRYPGVAYQAVKFRRESRLKSEELRVLYVAMTRPKDYLFMNYSSGEKLGFLSKVRIGAGLPAEHWAVDEAASLGEWILLSAMSRAEAGALFELSDRPPCELTVSEYPWSIRTEKVRNIPVTPYIARVKAEKQQVTVPDPERLTAVIRWKYPYETSIHIPSKLTATELKGREKDSEAAENTAVHDTKTTLLRPEFILEARKLSPTEIGTATHKFLQYADYSELTTPAGVQSELARMTDEEFLTEQQAESVDAGKIVKLFQSELGKKLLLPDSVIREYKFSLLEDAGDFYEAMQGAHEKVLMQGVIDAAIIEPSGITIVDFKTDRVAGTALQERAETYRPQVLTYRKALERILGMPVKACVLYFLHAAQAVTIT